MTKLFAVLALLAVSAVPTLAQAKKSSEGGPLFEVNGGYTFMRWQVPDFAQPPSSQNFNGFNAGAAYHFLNWLALAVDISGVYHSNPDVVAGTDTQHIFSYLAGPRIYPLGHHKLTPFVHGLVGVGSYHTHSPAVPLQQILAFDETDNNFSFAIGGGVDFNVTKHIAIRLGQLDYQQTRALRADAVASGGSAQNQNNFKYSGGVVFRFGEK